MAKVKRLIEIQEKKDAGFDDAGFPSEDYPTIKKAYAEINDLFGQEKYAAKQIMSEKITSFKIRYIPGITPDMYILFDEDRYEIVEPPDNVKYENKTLIIKAKLVI